MYFDPTWFLLIPVMIFALYAQAKVSGTYNKYSRVPAARGLTGAEAARRLLDAAGLSAVSIEMTGGRLTDHYDPRSRKLVLSEDNFHGRSVAALGVACHEAGHAIQHAQAYAPLQMRQAIWPVAGFGSWLAWPLFFLEGGAVPDPGHPGPLVEVQLQETARGHGKHTPPSRGPCLLHGLALTTEEEHVRPLGNVLHQHVRIIPFASPEQGDHLPSSARGKQERRVLPAVRVQIGATRASYGEPERGRPFG